jgi:proteasome lid subunit RPN8/RPN11
VITLVQRALDEIAAHAREESPRECCGLLVGTRSHVSASVRARNLAEAATRFLIDPRDHIAAIRSARAAQLDVVGFYHSHPRSRAYPSDTDRRESGYAEAMHLMVGVNESGEAEARLFTIALDGVAELPYRIVADDHRAEEEEGGSSSERT